jgi:hypothetical protein
MDLKFRILEMFPSEEDFDGDYYAIKVELNGEVIAEFGDYYHDNGDTKAEGFIKGYCKALNVDVPKYKTVNVVDTSIQY